LTLALEEGYVILEVYEVWDYPRRKKGLFADYLNAFLKGKQEVVGWPKNCTTTEARNKYMRDFEVAEGVKLNPANIGDEKNTTLYDLNKRCLNSFLGKWAEKQDQRQTRMTHEPKVFYDFLEDESRTEKKFPIVNDETLMLHWMNTQFAVGGSKKGNVVHAVFTTSHTRIHL